MASPQVHAQPKLLDPHRNAKYTLHVSDRIAKAKAGDTAYTSVKFNHKPPQTAPERETKITSNDSPAEPFTLSLTDSTEDGSGTYTYTGNRSSSKKSYVLLFDAAKQTCTLEPLDAGYTFNIQSTPFEPDAAMLARTYPRIKARKPSVAAAAAGTASDAEDGLFSDASDAHSAFGDGSPARHDGESDSDTIADENNPYDYRHFLNAAAGHETDGGVSPHPASAVATPQSHPRPTPLSQVRNAKDLPTPKPPPKQTTQRKRKSPEPAALRKPAAKPAAATTKPKTTKSSTTSGTSSKPKPSSTQSSTTAPPEIRLDRRASTRITSPPPSSTKHAAPPRQPSPAPSATRTNDSAEADADGDSDDDLGFEIDYGTGTGTTNNRRPAPPKRSIALAFGNNIASDGPISLRSAADSASPNSTLGTPAMGAARHRDNPERKRSADRDEIDFDDQSDEDDGYAEDDEAVPGEVDVGNQNLAEDSGGDEDADADEDVEPMVLGSPAQGREGQEQQLGDGQQGDANDDYDDFEAEITQALASAAEDVGEAGAEEVEEESEVESEEE
ncbi:hypothetical protein K490DRAFT_58171 [Saccharata proteae CBS 121410]|uniref:Transcription elongation factor Eaf N-terminal domain-containing protein n=1 Tax=Saccharata proteae CBS 121410 TaxID=1314787 RepID=A0A9P4HT11_9PEZI|nr:hypothetical protein K490DRAFT_58171 [Saccharata proteae CBS 121410]